MSRYNKLKERLLFVILFPMFAMPVLMMSGFFLFVAMLLG